MQMIRVLEGVLELHSEDDGQALSGRIGDDKEMGLYVELHSWVDHNVISQLAGGKVRVTIEAVE